MAMTIFMGMNPLRSYCLMQPGNSAELGTRK
jgi:hypothetical protein